jgi:hypothetical protein
MRVCTLLRIIERRAAIEYFRLSSLYFTEHLFNCCLLGNNAGMRADNNNAGMRAVNISIFRYEDEYEYCDVIDMTGTQ